MRLTTRSPLIKVQRDIPVREGVALIGNDFGFVAGEFRPALSRGVVISVFGEPQFEALATDTVLGFL